MIVDFVTYCHPGDAKRAHGPGVLRKLVDSQQYKFANLYVILQNCRGLIYPSYETPCTIIESEDYPDILQKFNIREDDPERACGDWNWHNGCINALIGLSVSKADYVVFADCDTYIEDCDNARLPWVQKGIEIIEQYPEVLYVTPGHGPGLVAGTIKTVADVALIKIGTQITFVCNRRRFLQIDYEMPIRGKPGSFHFTFEGRLQRFMENTNFYRAVLSSKYGKIHHNNWGSYKDL